MLPRRVEVEGGPCSALGGFRTNAAEQVTVEMFSECAGDTVESDGIDAGIDEAQAEADIPESIPELVVVTLHVGVEVKPDEEHVVREVADGEDDHEGQH